MLKSSRHIFYTKNREKKNNNGYQRLMYYMYENIGGRANQIFALESNQSTILGLNGLKH